ncbi:hypothetical protein P4135_10360, partial [Bacillus thuringiensis]|nr:hypothetical protein [Bacillus cereus]MED2731960.1 hypothetical protein [Bacillus thuringiensis]MED3637721.1 hypothetical protein [Bacillus thuringiensis]
MLKIIEKSFDLYLLNEKEGENIVECILHSYELFGEVEKNDEYVGHVLITIGKRKPFDFAIWKSDYEPGGNWTNHYVCLPTMLEENEDDELEIIPLGDLLEGMEEENDFKDSATKGEDHIAIKLSLCKVNFRRDCFFFLRSK